MNKQLLVNIRKTIIETRKRKQITQCQLAAMTGTWQPSISRFENGTYFPDLDFLGKIADSLGTEVVIDLKDKAIN